MNAPANIPANGPGRWAIRWDARREPGLPVTLVHALVLKEKNAAGQWQVREVHPFYGPRTMLWHDATILRWGTEREVTDIIAEQAMVVQTLARSMKAAEQALDRLAQTGRNDGPRKRAEAFGKQIKFDGQHLADARSEVAAGFIAQCIHLANVPECFEMKDGR